MKPTQKQELLMAPRSKYGPLLFGIAVASLFSAVAAANDLPVNVPANAAASSAGNFYVWAEGPWGPVRTTTVGVVPTLRNNSNDEIVVTPPPTGWDSITVFGPPAADSLRGGIGYVFPDGTFSPTFGSKPRLEFGASQTTTSIGSMPGNHNATVGSNLNSVMLGGCMGCTGSISTNYAGTRTSVKAASDFSVGAVTLTPSVSVYSANNRQNFSSLGSGDSGGDLHWKDTGTAIGLETKVTLAPALTLNVGGNVGVGNREAALTTTGTDPVTTRRNAAPLTGNAEARITYKPAEELELKGFTGIRSFDSDLPGIAASGSTPQIKYGADAGYYVGAGATFRFQTKD